MSVVNRVIVNPITKSFMCFRDLSMGQLFRAVTNNRQCENNVYIKIYSDIPQAVALWSGDVCSPAEDMEVERIPSVTIEHV